jgi:hypothetical protein
MELSLSYRTSTDDWTKIYTAKYLKVFVFFEYKFGQSVQVFLANELLPHECRYLKFKNHEFAKFIEKLKRTIDKEIHEFLSGFLMFKSEAQNLLLTSTCIIEEIKLFLQPFSLKNQCKHLIQKDYIDPSCLPNSLINYVNKKSNVFDYLKSDIDWKIEAKLSNINESL